MPLLVAAATDQTGRTITLLSAGLVAVAIGLTALTIWYWRFTSPRRRHAVTEAAEGPRPTTEEAQPGHEPTSPVEATPEAPVAAPDAEFQSESTPPTVDGDSIIGLDSEEWAMLTQAVLDEYLDS